MSAIRTFFAIDLPETIQHDIAKTMAELQKNIRHHAVRWTKPHNLHITLQFLPAVQSADIEKLITNIQTELNNNAATFQLKLGSLELFPTPHQPHIISLTVEPNSILTELARIIGHGILATHYPIEKRPFRGHVTLGRLNTLEKFSFANITTTLTTIPITEVICYQSTPSKEGSNYIPLAHLPLPTRR